MLRSLSSYLYTFKGRTWLISEEMESILGDLSSKYRNGGTHDKVVSYEICREAVDRIVLGRDSLLRRLIELTSD